MTFLAGSKFYVEMWTALRKGRGWSSSQSAPEAGRKKYGNGDYDDDDDDYDDNDDDNDGKDDYYVLSSSQRTLTLVSTSVGR